MDRPVETLAQVLVNAEIVESGRESWRGTKARQQPLRCTTKTSESPVATTLYPEL